MTLYIPCSMVAGRMQVLAVPRPPGVRVLSFNDRRRAIEASRAIVAETWVFQDHEQEYATYSASGVGDVGVWEAELDDLVAAGMSVGPTGFGVDMCVFNRDTMLVSVVESVDVQVEFDLDSVVARLEALSDMS